MGWQSSILSEWKVTEFFLANKRKDRSGHGLRALGSLIKQSLPPALNNGGYVQPEIISLWEEMVTPRLAKETVPQKLTFPKGRKSGGTLRIRAPAPLATELQHKEPIILDRINSFFGYKAVEKILIKHGNSIDALPGHKHAKIRPLDIKTTQKIESMTLNIQHSELRKALTALGKTLKSREIE